MKKINLTLAFTLFIMSFGFSQDLITLKSGQDISAKIIEVGINEIKYKKFDNIDGPTFTISKSDVLITRYKNGTKDIYNVENKEAKSNEDMTSQGAIDATSFYKGRNSGSVWTGVASILTSPVFGLIPAIACSSTEPSDENLNNKNPELMKNSSYNAAYTKKAHKIKKGKVWRGYAIGSGAWLLLFLIL
jgi:hypothetical protein